MAIVGYADLHCHPMAHLGFGGQHAGRALFWGKPTEAIDQALPCCTSAHSLLRGNGLLPHMTDHGGIGFDGYDTFKSWPRHTTVIHQQMYLDCVKRAFRGGLKLMIASAVNNELLSDLYHGQAVDSRDELAIEAQLTGMRAFAQHCSAWMEIVETPAQARAVIEAGKLAVVLAIEVDSIAGGPMRREGQLDPSKAKALVERWWRAGVRLINPVHLADNALGGSAIFDDRFNLANHYLTRKWSQRLPEPWFYEVEAATGEHADVRFLLGANPANTLLIQLYNQGYPAYVKRIGATGHVNKRGLSPAGAAFVHAMMDRNMLIDVEHMSSHALDATLLLAEQRSYPLISSHTGFRALAVPRSTAQGAPLHVQGCAHEAMRSDRQLRALHALGSLIGIGGHIGRVQDLKVDSSAGWARSYRHARDQLGFDAIAIGTDMNGFAAAPGPRFRSSGGKLVPLDAHDVTRSIRYGQDLIPMVGQTLEQVALGKKSFSYNTDGFAHYGMLPDFTLDIALSLGGEESLRAFFNSAEAFIATWQRCAS